MTGMSESRSRSARISRESRVLVLTVVVCAGVLLLMARLRFPEPAPATPPEQSPAPLERLAARASYDALAADVQRVEPAIAPNLIVLRIIALTGLHVLIGPILFNFKAALQRAGEVPTLAQSPDRVR